MFEYDYLTKSINGFRFFVVGDDNGDDYVVAYITPQGKTEHCTPFYADMESILDWLTFEQQAAA